MAVTASPSVSSTIGLKNVVIAPLTADTETELTYGTVQAVAGAIEASVTPDNTDPNTHATKAVSLDNRIQSIGLGDSARPYHSKQ